MSKRFLAFVSIGCLAFVVTVSAENWPAWRGPLANGVSGEKGLPIKWSTTENIAWKLAMPSRSGATPIIWGDHIFLNVATALATGDLELWAVDRKKGEPIWKRPLSGGNIKLQKQNMSTPSPVTDGTTVWVMTGTGILKAFDFKGTELWTRDIQKDYGQFGLNRGYASSPLLHQGSLYIQVLHGMKTDDPSYVMKVDGKSGKTLWKVDRPTHAISESPDSYTTPLLVGSGKSAEIVITGRRHRHGTRSRDRQGALAGQRAQSHQRSVLPHRRVPRACGRPRHRADAESTDARAQAGRRRAMSRRATRRGASTSGRTCRRPSATASSSMSSATTASFTRST